MLTQSKIKYLDKERVLTIVQEMLSADTSIHYNLKVSKSTFSIYIRLYYGNCFISRRISDHPSRHKIKTLQVGTHTKCSQVKEFLKSAVKQLKRVHVVDTLNRWRRNGEV